MSLDDLTDFQNLDRRPARRAGQRESETMAPIADQDRRGGAPKFARAALLTLAVWAAAGALHDTASVPTAMLCTFACAIAVVSLYTTRGDG